MRLATEKCDVLLKWEFLVDEKNEKTSVWFWLSALVIVFDQVAKYAIVRHWTMGGPINILPFLNFTLNYNTGAAFSFLGSESGWQIYFFAAFSLAVVAFLIAWLSCARRSDHVMAIGPSLVIGGALGNFIDRVRLGYVVDFIDFHIKNWHYATFNIADSAICIGASLLIIRMMFMREPRQ